MFNYLTGLRALFRDGLPGFGKPPTVMGSGFLSMFMLETAFMLSVSMMQFKETCCYAEFENGEWRKKYIKKISLFS